jgi:hypothetical protein
VGPLFRRLDPLGSNRERRAARSHRRLATAARACRSLAYQEGEAAKRLENPTVRAPIEGTAKRAAALAEKFERARRKG